ncbi:MAG: phage tail protein I, partial [Shewanella sp.]|nr:phage tail protein I [Shewanella sp.]
LPWLAWALSVDRWRTSWGENTKRQVVASSLSVHRRKGTRPAVSQALSALGVEAEFTEWFQATPRAQPGTFELVAWANENLTDNEATFLNAALYEQIRQSVNSAKNTRSHYTFKVGAKFKGSDIGTVATATGAGINRHHAELAQQALKSVGGMAAGSYFNIAATARPVMAATIHGPIKLDSQVVQVTTAGHIAARGVLHTQMEATT